MTGNPRRGQRDTTRRPKVGQDDPPCMVPSENWCTTSYSVEERRYVTSGPGAASRAAATIDIKTASPEAIVQHLVDLKAANFFGGGLSATDAQAIGQRLGYLAGMGDRLGTPVRSTYQHPLFGTQVASAANPRAGLASLLQQTFPEVSAHALAGFDRGAARGTAARQEVAAALGELKHGLSHEQLAAVGHRLGKAVRALPAGAGQVLPLDQVAQGLKGVPGGEQLVAYLRATGTHTPQGMINLTAATGYVSDPAAQQILKESFAAGVAGRPVLGERRIAQIEAKPAKVDTPAGRAIARMEQISGQLTTGAATLSAEQLVKLAHDFGTAARTPILSAGRVSLAGVGTQVIPDAMLPQILRQGIERTMGARLPKEPAQREAAIGQTITVVTGMLKATGNPITSAMMFETLVVGNLVPPEHREAVKAALQAGLKGQRLPAAGRARTSELEGGTPRLAELPDDARAQVAAVVASLDVTLTEAGRTRPEHELPEHLRAAAREGGQPAMAQG